MAKKKNSTPISINNVIRKKVTIKEKPVVYPKCDNPNNLYVPNSTCVVITKFGLDKIENFHLKLNKFAQFSDELNRFKFDEKIEEFDFQKYKEVAIEYKKQMKKFLKISDFEFKTDYRLLIGAEQSIYEISIRLHHIYGIPYIPSTAIKGVVRSHFIEKYFYDEKNSEQEAFKDDDFKNYFGTQEQEGKIVFLDAFPTTKPIIKVDIMNPHYGHYYNDGEAPTDTKNPIPINFLTVEDTTFQFLIGFKDEVDNSFTKLFKEALTEHGIGAKTAVGYGYFEVQKPKKR